MRFRYILMMGTISIIAILAAAAVIVTTACIYYASYAVRSQWFGRAVWRGRTDTGSVALTFDDGPSADTAALLDTLLEHDLKATFFMVGEHVEKFPQIAQRIVADGHEIGNHSMSHKILLYCSRRRTESEINRAQEVITSVTGVAPQIARPPCGVRTPRYFRTAEILGLSTVQWTVAGFDWKTRSAHEIADAVVRDAEAGSIVLLHDGDSAGRSSRQATVDAIPLILAGMRKKGLSVVPLRELLFRAETGRMNGN